MINKSIFVWSPFTGKIGTVKNVINSLYSINKYSNYSTHLINAFGEWDALGEWDAFGAALGGFLSSDAIGEGFGGSVCGHAMLMCFFR